MQGGEVGAVIATLWPPPPWVMPLGVVILALASMYFVLFAIVFVRSLCFGDVASKRLTLPPSPPWLTPPPSPVKATSTGARLTQERRTKSFNFSGRDKRTNEFSKAAGAMPITQQRLSHTISPSERPPPSFCWCVPLCVSATLLAACIVLAALAPHTYSTYAKACLLLLVAHGAVLACVALRGLLRLRASEGEDLLLPLSPSPFYYAFVLPNYLEDIGVLRATLAHLATHPCASQQYLVLLAMDRRETRALDKARELEGEFGEQFYAMDASLHAEAVGRSALASSAGSHLSDMCRQRRLAADRVLVTLSDSDTFISPRYVLRLDALLNGWLRAPETCATQLERTIFSPLMCVSLSGSLSGNSSRAAAPALPPTASVATFCAATTPTMRVLPPPSVGRCPPPRRHHAALTAAESEAAVEYGFQPAHPSGDEQTPSWVSEMADLLTSVIQLMQLTRGGALGVPHATYTASLAALESIGFWDAGAVGGGDEVNTLLRLHHAMGGAARTETIYEAFWVQPLSAPSLVQAVRRQLGRATDRAHAHVHLGISLWRGWTGCNGCNGWTRPALKPCATVAIIASMLEPFLWLGGSFICLAMPIAARASADASADSDASSVALLISAVGVAAVTCWIAELLSSHDDERSVLDWLAAMIKWLCAPLLVVLFHVLPSLSAHVALFCHSSKIAALERAAAAIDARRGPVAGSVRCSPARIGGLTTNGKLDMSAVRAAVDKEVADGSISQRDANLLLSMASAHNGSANLLDSLRLKGAAIASIFSSAGAPPAATPPPAPPPPAPATATDDWWMPRPRAGRDASGAPPPPPPPPRSEVLRTPPRPTSLTSPRGGLTLV